VRLYHALKADRVVAEKNYGGDMVESTIRAFDNNVAVFPVTATRGKLVRAEPVCAGYEQGEIHHAGEFQELEDEMVTYVPGDKSPNRMDALVWALTELRENMSTMHLSDISQPQKYRPVMMGIMKEVI
jgi:phage terminase large subunit-like protein